MINLRFHVTAVATLAAALATGIAVGAAALHGPVAQP